MAAFVLVLASSSASFTARPVQRTVGSQRARLRAVVASAVELQSECGRGQQHLSARLEEGDVCVYQVGTWLVDWVPVGPGDAPRLLLAKVECLQVNLAHLKPPRTRTYAALSVVARADLSFLCSR